MGWEDADSYKYRLPPWWLAVRDSVRGEDLARRGLRAMALAPDLEVYGALLQGEAVPVSALDQEALKRYGLK